MNSESPRHNIIDFIKEKDIKPTPGWVFKLKTTGGWILFLLAVLLGGLAFSVVLYAIQQSEFTLLNHLGHSGLEIFLSLLPFIWLGFLVLFFVVSIFGIRHSWKGYKIPLLKQALGSIGLSISIGTLFFIGGGGEWLDRAYGNTLSGYETIEDRKIQVWSNPDEGYLSGYINEINDDQLIISDFRDRTWTIDIKDSWIAPPVLIEVGERIKVVGEITGRMSFHADEIRPWGGRQRMRNRNNQ